MVLFGLAMVVASWWYFGSERILLRTIEHQTDANVQQEMQEECENDADFAWIPAGSFIYGSDRAEREYAYQISAVAIAKSSRNQPSGNQPSGSQLSGSQVSEVPNAEAIAQAEANLRRNRWFDREPKRQERSLPGFCLQRNLVTNADYHTFVQATGHRSPYISEQDYQDQGFLVHPYQTVLDYLWSNQTYPEGKSLYPVVLVSYDDALAYAQWKGQQDNATYRLPTADEWEKAARGTDGRYFPWGDAWQDNGTNWSQNKSGTNVTGPGTSAIAHFPLSQSIYDIEDMAGNVFEYTSTLRRRPQGLRSVMKGCSWDDWPGFCRAAYEHTRPVNSRHILFGFRLVHGSQNVSALKQNDGAGGVGGDPPQHPPVKYKIRGPPTQ
ncbi:MAG: SUMF1/EgtB/PvdO family nonheme iron enzyme, partial [Cyanobacteria bacterium P01_F01_bin.150]